MTDNDKGKKTILFNATKKETHHPNSGFKKLFRRLKSNFKISANKDEVSRDRLAEADLLVFGGPSEPFTSAEFDELKAYLHGGGRALVMMGDGGEKQSGTNMNYLLEEFGMSVNPDSVLRSVYYKYVHPKEVFISDGVLVPDILRKKNTVTLGGARKGSANKNTPAAAGTHIQHPDIQRHIPLSLHPCRRYLVYQTDTQHKDIQLPFPTPIVTNETLAHVTHNPLTHSPVSVRYSLYTHLLVIYASITIRYCRWWHSGYR